MKIVILLNLFSLICATSLAQDERFFKSNTLPHIKRQDRYQGVSAKKSSIDVAGSIYQLDLDEDGFSESFQIVQKDGIDYLRVLNSNGMLLFEERFQTKGPRSRVYKAELRTLSSITKVLVFYYFEGVTNYMSYINKGHLYYLTIDKNKITSLGFNRGPVFWVEHKTISDTYSQRKFDVNLLDINGDGVKELRAKYHKIESVSMYKGDGTWLTF